MKLRREYKQILANPKSYYAKLPSANLKHNNKLKFILLQSIKPLRLKRYKRQDIFRVAPARVARGRNGVVFPQREALGKNNFLK
jgi:hypothetical protein